MDERNHITTTPRRMTYVADVDIVYVWTEGEDFARTRPPGLHGSWDGTRIDMRDEDGRVLPFTKENFYDRVMDYRRKVGLA